MFARFRYIALLALLLVLPLQGLAAVIAPLNCLSTGDHHSTQTAGHASHEHDSSHHGPSHHGSGEDPGTADVAGHMECHHVFSAVPMSFGAPARGDLPVFQATLSLLATLYIPELPQRPPRA